MEEKVLNIIKRVFELTDVRSDVSQSNCVKWDSLNHLNLVLEVEMEFDISFSPEEITEIKNFSDLLNAIEKLN